MSTQALRAIRRRFAQAASTAALLVATLVPAAPVPAVQELARQEQQPLLDTLRDLVAIESGSKDLEGLEKIAALIAELAPGTDMEALGDQIRAVVRDNAPAGADVEKLQDQVFEMFHQVMAQTDSDPAAKAHLKEMLTMVTAARTDPAAREHFRMMLAMHAGG
jgi:hypothetical protein